MTYGNLSYVLDLTAKENIQKSFDDGKAEFAKFWINLPDDEKSKLSKMGADGYSYVTKALNFTGVYPSFMPNDVSIPEFGKDMQLYNDLMPYLIQALALVEGIIDTMTVAGAEAKKAADDYYDAVTRAKDRSNPEAQAVWEELKTFYEKAKAEVPPAIPATV